MSTPHCQHLYSSRGHNLTVSNNCDQTTPKLYIYGCGPTTSQPRITGPPGIALATDRQEDWLQAVPVGPQGVDRAGADVHHRHVDTCLQCAVTEHSTLSHQRRLGLHRAAYKSQAWREGFFSRRTESLEPAADQTENINLFHWQFQTLSQNMFISVCLRLWNMC